MAELFPKTWQADASGELKNPSNEVFSEAEITEAMEEAKKH